MIQADIRAAVRAALLAGTGLTSDHIWAYPNAAIPTALMPGISVFTISDKPVREDDDHAVQHERLFTFVVDVQVAAPQAESATDALATLVRTSLLSDDTLGGPFSPSAGWIRPGGPSPDLRAFQAPR